MSTYEVKTQLNHDGQIFEPGEIFTGPEEVAEKLVTEGVVAKQATKPEPKPVEAPVAAKSDVKVADGDKASKTDAKSK